MEWISVEDRLPEVGVLVQLWNYSVGNMCGYLSENKKAWYILGIRGMYYPLKYSQYWIQLQKPPEAGE